MSMMTLWLPTLLSAVAVFVLSSVIHMALPWWHRSDYNALPNEAGVLDALRPFAIPPGEYLAPRPSSHETMRSPEFIERHNRGPVFSINVREPGPISMSKPLAMWFVYILVVSFFAGHISRIALGATPDIHDIMHTVGLTAFMGYSFALWQASIWFSRPVRTTAKATVDGFIYAIVTGLIFMWLWR